MLGNPLCPADRRIQTFLDDYLKDVCPLGAAQIPGETFLLDRPGIARVLSLPLSGNALSCDYLQSYRVQQGISADQEEPVRLFVSLLLRPIVCPATQHDPQKSMEIRFFAPGSLVSNLDFVEGIFGNGGDPYLPEIDAALDMMHWTGHRVADVMPVTSCCDPYHVLQVAK